MKPRLQIIAEILMSVPVPPDDVALPKLPAKRPGLSKARPRGKTKKDRAA